MPLHQAIRAGNLQEVGKRETNPGGGGGGGGGGRAAEV
jgi:hypothetical protein